MKVVAKEATEALRGERRQDSVPGAGVPQNRWRLPLNDPALEHMFPGLNNRHIISKYLIIYSMYWRDNSLGWALAQALEADDDRVAVEEAGRVDLNGFWVNLDGLKRQ